MLLSKKAIGFWISKYIPVGKRTDSGWRINIIALSTVKQSCKQPKQWPLSNFLLAYIFWPHAETSCTPVAMKVFSPSFPPHPVCLRELLAFSNLLFLPSNHRKRLTMIECRHRHRVMNGLELRGLNIVTTNANSEGTSRLFEKDSTKHIPADREQKAWVSREQH